MLSWVLAAAVLAACVSWLAWSASSGGGAFDPVRLYGVALFIRLALQFISRTFHSGAYAVRRVYRPAWAVITAELVAFTAVLLAWPALGPWALPLGALAASLAGGGLTIHFTRRLYRFMGLAPRWWRAAALRSRRPLPWRELLAAGLSFAVMKLDAILIFGLFTSFGAASRGPELFVLLFVLSPTVQAGFDWAQLFYFDLKRLDPPLLGPLLEQYRRYMSRLAWTLGFVFWALGSVMGTIVYLRSLGELYWLLCPFFVTRSLVASAQIQAFCARRYGALLGTASLWLLGFIAARQVSGDPSKLALVTLATAAVYVALSRFTRPAHLQSERWVGVVEWLDRLGRTPGPVRIRSATVLPALKKREARDAWRAARWGPHHVARAIAVRLGDGGAVTVLPPDRLVWFEASRTARIRPDALAAISGGVARVVHETPFRPEGRLAVLDAWREHGVSAVFGGMPLEPARGLSVAALERSFASLFPDGVVFRAGRPAPVPAPPVGGHRRIIAEACRFITDLRPPRATSPVDVTALCVSGRLRLVFVAAPNGRPESLRRWRAMVCQANVVAATAGAVD
jgi:hypothetical protein